MAERAPEHQAARRANQPRISTAWAKPDAAPRRYYVGTRFSTGIIAAEAWHEEMLFDGLSERAIASVADWLRVRAL